MSSFHGEQTPAYLIMKNYGLTNDITAIGGSKGNHPEEEPDVRLLSYCGLPSYLP